MTLFLLSLAGIPPTAGFIAKVNVFAAAIGEGYWALALIGVLASVAAAFFYLRVIVLMYMREPVVDAVPAPGLRVAEAPVGAILAIPAAATLLLGVFPGIVVGIIEEASVLRW
jgi:NADH-quinone oxidoreductase subunit N